VILSARIKRDEQFVYPFSALIKKMKETGLCVSLQHSLQTEDFEKLNER